MANESKPTAKAEATPKGVRKVNLSELQGNLSRRGRERYDNPVLKEALLEMLTDGQPIIWDEAVPEGKTEKAFGASKAKWRNRAVSVFDSLNSGKKISVQWTTENEMVISLKAD